MGFQFVLTLFAVFGWTEHYRKAGLNNTALTFWLIVSSVFPVAFAWSTKVMWDTGSADENKPILPGGGRR